METLFWITQLGFGWWALILFVLGVFLPERFTLMFYFAAWAVLGFWLLEIGIDGYREKYIGAFVATNDVDVYGTPAVFVSILVIFLATIIFILPGIGLMIKEINKLRS